MALSHKNRIGYTFQNPMHVSVAQCYVGTHFDQNTSVAQPMQIIFGEWVTKSDKYGK